jgi:hypothetical protein
MTLAAILSRPMIARLAAALLAAQMLGFVTPARAGDTAEPPAPPPGSRREMRRALREFDRFLDHHPLLEDQLRLNPPLTASPSFLNKNPELRDFLLANPNVVEGMNAYPRYYLNRGLLRQANAPLSFKELAPFKDLFQQHPEIQQELTANPELIRDPSFLESHAALHDFLVGHTALAQVFLPSTVTSEHK